MTRVGIRIIAALVLVVISGLPVATVVCAQVCLTPSRAAGAGDDAPCHKSDLADTNVMRGTGSDGCDPFGAATIATRERVAPSLNGVPLTTPPSHVRDIVWLGDPVICTIHATPTKSGLSPGACRPLRI